MININLIRLFFILSDKTKNTYNKGNQEEKKLQTMQSLQFYKVIKKPLNLRITAILRLGKVFS